MAGSGGAEDARQAGSRPRSRPSTVAISHLFTSVVDISRHFTSTVVITHLFTSTVAISYLSASTVVISHLFARNPKPLPQFRPSNVVILHLFTSTVATSHLSTSTVAILHLFYSKPVTPSSIPPRSRRENAPLQHLKRCGVGVSVQGLGLSCWCSGFGEGVQGAGFRVEG